MKNLNTEIRSKILDFLSTKRIGASSSQISKSIGHNRITVTKYLEILKAQKQIDYEGIAQAKLWSINKKNDKPRVLIVDDEPHIVNLIALSLIPEKFLIQKAYSGLDALDLVYQHKPDIIILDLMMPGINGLEICQKLKSNSLTQNIPIIMLSAKGEVEDKLKGLQIGADDYLTKPFDPMELEARVERVIRRTNQNMDSHPLTKLPGQQGIIDKLEQSINNTDKFVVTSYRLKNFAEFNNSNGYKKGDNVVLMLSRMFSDIIKDRDAFVGHTIKDNFIVIGEDISGAVKSEFKKLLPYMSIDKKLELMSKKLDSTAIYGKNLNTKDVFTKLGVT